MSFLQGCVKEGFQGQIWIGHECVFEPASMTIQNADIAFETL